jgi:DNA invertase Pin-like site-specific DNA recombinase
MVFGYINDIFSPLDLAQQIEMLSKKGCKEFIIEKPTKNSRMPKLEAALSKPGIRAGDSLLVCALDIFNLTTLELVQLVDRLNRLRITFTSLDIDDILRGDNRLFTVLAKYHQDKRRQRAITSLATTRQRGLKGGRKPGITDEKLKIAHAAASLYQSLKPKYAVSYIMEFSGIKSKATFYKYLRAVGVEIK